MVLFSLFRHLRIKMTDYLLDELITIKQGYEIYCQVTGDKADDKPYILLIPGGPGFTHIAMEELAASLTKQNQAMHGTSCHFILFDPLHCGKSDKATNFETEFTVENYAEIAAQVIEAVQEKLGIPNMDLRLIGRSFGSMTAMTIPICRPEWIMKSDAPIKLNQLISIVGPISHEAINQSSAYVEKNYTYRNDFDELKTSVNTLMTGTIQNPLHYQQAIACGLAPLYADKYETMKEGALGKMMMSLPNFTRTILGGLSWVSSSCAGMYDALTGCSLDVLNYFFSHQFNQFNLLEKIAAHKEVYEALPIYCVSGSRDYVAEPSINADLLHEQLPNSLTEINFDSKHSIGTDHPQIYPQLIHLILEGKLTTDYLERHVNGDKKALHGYKLAASFNQQAEIIQQINKSHKPSIRSSWFDFFGIKKHVATDEISVTNTYST